MTLLFWLAVALGCAASFDDLRRRAVANWINVAGLAAGLVYHSVERGWAGLAWSAGGAAAGFAVLLLLPPQQNLWGDSGSGSRPKL